MPLSSVLSVSVDRLRGLSLADAARNGRVLEARVTAMLSDTLARITIDGQTVDVATPRRLPIGAAMTLRVEREGGQLRLVTQGPIRGPDNLPLPAPEAPDIHIEPLRVLLGQVQEIAVEAELARSSAGPQTLSPQLQGTAVEELQSMLAEGIKTDDAAEALAARSKAMNLDALLDDFAGTDPAEAATPRTPAGTEARAAVHHSALPPENAAPDARSIAASLSAAAREAAAELRRAGGMLPGAAPDMAAAQTAADLTGAQIRAERGGVHFSFDVPLHLPGNPAPLRLEVSRDDEAPEETEDGNPRPRSWTIRFSAEAGPLGMIHAAITQAGDHVGVRLWAESRETATLFSQHAAQLQDAMEASNLKLEGLRIAQGRPSQERPSEGQHPIASDTEPV